MPKIKFYILYIHSLHTFLASWDTALGPSSSCTGLITSFSTSVTCSSSSRRTTRTSWTVHISRHLQHIVDTTTCETLGQHTWKTLRLFILSHFIISSSDCVFNLLSTYLNPHTVSPVASVGVPALQRYHGLIWAHPKAPPICPALHVRQSVECQLIRLFSSRARSSFRAHHRSGSVQHCASKPWLEHRCRNMATMALKFTTTL